MRFKIWGNFEIAFLVAVVHDCVPLDWFLCDVDLPGMKQRSEITAKTLISGALPRHSGRLSVSQAGKQASRQAAKQPSFQVPTVKLELRLSPQHNTPKHFESRLEP